MKFLDQWGYIEKENIIPNPFSPRNKGLLIPGFHVSKAASILNSHLFSIEPIFIACMFAHFAINIITSSGARMNELLQISYDKECCVITIDRSNMQHKKNIILRLTPKGREEPENYYVPEEIFKTMHEIIEELKLHYKDQKLPKVKYEVEARKHILMDERRFVFQYNNKHLNVFTINSIIKFLLHGIIIEDSKGEQVLVKAHLLRHAFATHAVQTEKIPIDIVREFLHQKDLEVTEYYSRPTNFQIAESIDLLNDSLIAVLDIQKGLIRAPQELKDMYEDYKDKVGTLSKVTGGICTIDSVCPTRMARVGCGAKVPRPDFKNELLDYYNWASESEKKFIELGLTLEANKMKISKNRARNELKEIELIEKTRGDALFEPQINFKQGKGMA